MNEKITLTLTRDDVRTILNALSEYAESTYALARRPGCIEPDAMRRLAGNAIKTRNEINLHLKPLKNKAFPGT